MTLEDGLYSGGGVDPNNADTTPEGVYAYGPNDLDEAEADDGSSIHAGLVLIRDATSGEVSEAGAGATDIVGVAKERHVAGGSEDFFATYTAADDGNSIAGEKVPFYHRIGVGVYLKLAASQTVNPDDMLQTAAGGLVQLLTPAAAADIGKHKFTYKGKTAVTTAAGESAWILAERVA